MITLIKEPLDDFSIIDIPFDLNTLHKTVGGYIECTYPFDPPFVVISDEEAAINDKPFNCTLNGITYYGTILIATVDKEEFRGLSTDEVTLLRSLL